MSRRPHLDRRGHCGLEVRATDHGDGPHVVSERAELGRKLEEFRLRREDRVLHVEPHVHRDLVVAAAAGVDLLPEVAELLREKTLDRHVDVLVVDADLELACKPFSIKYLKIL